MDMNVYGGIFYGLPILKLSILDKGLVEKVTMRKEGKST